MKRINIKKWTIIALALVAAYTLLGFFAAGPLVKWVAEKKLSERLQRQVTIEKISFNPYALTATIEGLAVKARQGGGNLVAFDSLFANLQGSSLFRRGGVVSELRLANPQLHIIRKDAGTYNFSDLIPPAEDTPPPPETPAEKRARFSVNNIQVTGGRIEFSDDFMGKKHEVSGITLTLPFISSFDPDVDIFVEPRFTAEVNGKPVSLRGKSKPFTSRLETVVDIDITDVDVPYYLAYVPAELKFKVPSALLDVKASLNFAVAEGKDASLVVTGDTALKSVSIEDIAGEPLVKWQRLDVTIAPSELLRGNLHLSRVALRQPEITLKRETDGTINIQKAIPAPAADPGAPPSGAATPPLTLLVDEIALDQGRVLFTDLYESPSFETTLYPINLTISGLSNQKNRPASVSLTLDTEAEETLTLSGQFSIDPLRTTGTVSLARAVLAKYAPYYDDYAKFTVDSGRLDFQTGFQADLQAQPPAITLSGLSSRLYELKLKRIGMQRGFADIPELVVDQTEVDLNRRSIAVGEIRSENGILAITRLKIGDLNIQDLFEPPQQATRAEGEAAGSEPPFSISVAHLLLDHYTVEGEDQTFAEPTRMVLDQMRLEVEDFSTTAQSQAAVDFSGRYNKKGTISTRGMLGIDPLAGKMAVKLAGYEPLWFQKYFEDQVQVIATGGKIDAQGDLAFGMTEDKGLTLSYRGDVTVSDFKSVERSNADEFISFKKLAIDDAAVEINPTSVTIKKIGLDGFFTRLVLTKDGRLNVQDTVRQDGARSEKGDSAAKSEPVPIRIGTVALSSGKIKFFDQFVAPGYSTLLGGIDGTLSGLTTDKTKAADIKIKASLDEQAPLEITGKVNPLADELYADVAIKFDAVDLSPLSPYSGKYAGYTIQKGKLSLDLNYLIENKTLTSKNRVYLDQFDFGKRVDSPEATDLPVTLAVALLKDRSGKITLDLPVSGRMDDPEFSIGGIILKMIVNLLVKAATAPFALVQAVLGGGEELDQIEFDAGSRQLNEAATGKLDQLVTALYDRPGLKLEISGHVDAVKDGEGLAATLFENKLKAQKLKALTGQGTAAGSLEEVTLLPEEHDLYLVAAFNEAKIPLPEKPAAPPGAKNAPPAGNQKEQESRLLEMERLLKENIHVSDSDLKALARDRAISVKGYLLKSDKVEPERIFLVDPGTLAAPLAEGIKNSRVVLGLK